MKPLLAHVYEPHRIPNDGTPVFVQPKLNGIRALAGTDRLGRWRFQSRDEHPWEYEVLQHLSEELKTLGIPEDTILDGELYVHGWPLQRINGAVSVNRKSVREDTAQVEYHIFDVVNFKKSFKERTENLRVMIECAKPQQPVHIKSVITYGLHGSLHDPEQLYANFVRDGYEGIMYRIGDCPYTRPKQPKFEGLHYKGTQRLKYLSDQDNRVWHLLKRKDWQDGEFFCVGVKEGEGKREGMVGAFVCNTKENDPEDLFDGGGLTTFSVGSFLGFTDADLTHYLHNPPIGRNLKVKYLCLSSSGIPLNPSLLAIL